MTTFFTFVYVGVGGMAGAMARYGLLLLMQGTTQVFPLATLAANLAGCFLIGVIAELAAGVAGFPPQARLLLVTGFCGGFTTLSSLVFELDRLLREGEFQVGGIYLLATLAGGYLALWLGMWAIRLLMLNWLQY
mgnify:CR=1 FL=1